MVIFFSKISTAFDCCPVLFGSGTHRVRWSHGWAQPFGLVGWFSNIFSGQVTIRFDACEWLSNVHHRSNNFIAPVYGKFPSFLVSILFSGILGRWWELCILGKLIWIDSVERRSHSPTYYSHESALPATNHLIVIFLFLFLLFFCILLHHYFLRSN